jgi:hypothetical protein
VRIAAVAADAVTESGTSAAKADGVRLLGFEGGLASFAVGSGEYAFESTTP